MSSPLFFFKDITFPVEVMEADICDPFIFVRLKNHKLKMFEVLPDLTINDRDFPDENVAVTIFFCYKYLVTISNRYHQFYCRLKYHLL